MRSAGPRRIHEPHRTSDQWKAPLIQFLGKPRCFAPLLQIKTLAQIDPWVLGREMSYFRSRLIHFLHAIAAVIEVIGCAICGTLLNSVHLTRRSHMIRAREGGLGQVAEFVRQI